VHGRTKDPATLGRMPDIPACPPIVVHRDRGRRRWPSRVGIGLGDLA
jgi:hypothetical protein